jgi:streptogramin lyase
LRTSTFSAAAALLLAALGTAAAAHPSRGIVVAADGTVFFSDLVKVRAIYPDGKTRVVRVNAAGHTHALALARDGAVWGDQSEYDPANGSYREAIWRMRPDGSLTYRYGPRKGVARGVGLLRDRRGCTWHADRVGSSGGMVVHRRCPGRKAERLFGTLDDDRAFRPVLVNDFAGTALDSEGGFVFRDRVTIRRIAPEGTVTVLARGLSGDNFGIAAGPGGSVLVAEHGARRVTAVAPGRAARTLAISAPPWAPTGVAWRQGSLYILEASDHRPGRAGRMRVRRIGRDGAPAVLAEVAVPSP